MKLSTVFLMATLLATLLASPIWARPPAAPEPGPPPFEPLIEALSLTDDQIEPVQEILERHHERMRGLHDAMRFEMRSQKETLDSDVDAELAEFLSPGQLEAFQELRQNRPPRPPRPRRAPSYDEQ